MSEPMTEAEQAVADVLEGDSACTWHVGCDVEDCYGPRAKAIVAKLRPLLAAEALEDMADRFEAYGSLVGEKAWPFVTELRGAVAALRTTTPEHKGDPR
jgi:hypothetical protein